jgi:hypothetical protein
MKTLKKICSATVRMSIIAYLFIQATQAAQISDSYIQRGCYDAYRILIEKPLKKEKSSSKLFSNFQTELNSFLTLLDGKYTTYEEFCFNLGKEYYEIVKESKSNPKNKKILEILRKKEPSIDCFTRLIDSSDADYLSGLAAGYEILFQVLRYSSTHDKEHFEDMNACLKGQSKFFNCLINSCSGVKTIAKKLGKSF